MVDGIAVILPSGFYSSLRYDKTSAVLKHILTISSSPTARCGGRSTVTAISGASDSTPGPWPASSSGRVSWPVSIPRVTPATRCAPGWRQPLRLAARPSERSCARAAGPAGRWSTATSATGRSGKSAPPPTWGCEGSATFRLVARSCVPGIEKEGGKMPYADQSAGNVHGSGRRGGSL